MSYYGDVLDGSHNNLGVETDEPGKLDDPKAMAIKVKSGKGGLSLAQSLDMSKKGSDWKYGSKVEASKKFDDEHKLKLTAKNKEYECQWNFSPADLNKDGTETELEVSAKCNPGAQDYDVTANLALGGFGNDTVKSWTNLEVNTDLKALKEATFSENLAIKNDDQTYHLGGKGLYNVGDKKLDEVHAHLVASGFKWGEAWTRLALLNAGKHKGQFVSAGVCMNEDKKQIITSEASWDLSQKYKGFQGMPLLWNTSMKFKFSNGASVNWKFLLGKESNIVGKSETPIVDGAKMIYHCQADLNKMLFNPKDV